MAKRKDLKGRSLREGEGQRPDGLYYFRYTDASGKRRAVYSKDLPALRQKEEAALRDKADGIAPGTATLNDMFGKYGQVSTIRDHTMRGYERAWDLHVREGMGTSRVADVKVSDIRAFYAGLAREGLSTSTIGIIAGLLRACLGMAVEDGLIRYSPAARVSASDYGRPPKKKDALTPEQQARLLWFAAGHSVYSRHFPLLVIMIGLALRAGELIALTWDDVDFGKREVRITKQLIYKNRGEGYRFCLSEPKTRAGIRTIPMTPEVRDAFLKQKELCLAFPNDVTVEGLSGFVFPSRDGGPMMPAALNNILYNIVKAYNRREDNLAKNAIHGHAPEYLPKFSAHVLRHTGCTRMAEGGVDLKVISYVMGHADCGVTLDVYEHITESGRIARELEKIKVSECPGETPPEGTPC